MLSIKTRSVHPASRFHPLLPPALGLLLVLVHSIAAARELRGPVQAEHGMVVSASPRASEAGVEILRAGGNAFDAAAATGFVLAVTFPQAGNLGGGGFMVARTSDGRNLSLDFRERAPSKAHRDMYLDENGEVIEGLSLRSPLASGVPGSVHGLLSIWERDGSGRITREELLAPAIRLAAEGFPLSQEMAQSFNLNATVFEKDPGASKVFIRADGRPWQEGDLLVQGDLARTLRRISAEGRAGFYRGEVAGLIARQQAISGGLITREDLADYTSVYRDPVVGTFRDYEIVSMGPPSSGGVLLIQILNMLDGRPLAAYARGSMSYVHLLTEVQRRAYADRAQHLGDPDFWKVPVVELTSKQYAKDRAKSIDKDRASPSSEVAAGIKIPQESGETTHYSVVDAERNAVAMTVTLNGLFGSGIMIGGAGFLMNNEMDDFSVKPGVPNLYGVVGGEANAIEAGKRMLSSMTPTVVIQDGRPVMVLGSPGGPTIITTVLQVFLNVGVHGMDIQEAVAAPRHHSQWLPDRIMYEEGAFTKDVIDKLRAMGHVITDATATIGAANCIYIGEQNVYGAPDYRRQSSAAGY
ncbi:MAG: gamma-glutamyltransferase [Candidatus Hydrogenedentes bacterium]|nr:gamma-glutamyltransferase [Candidatus Hydrogenedentota bacterium]